MSQCSFSLGRFDEAEIEFVEGIALAQSIGEHRVVSLLKPNYSVLQATTGRLDEALQTALENLEQSGPTSLLYSRFEALRCLAAVRFIRALKSQSEDVGHDLHSPTSDALSPENAAELSDLDATLRLCEEASALVSPTESRVSRLWLGPLYIEVLLAKGRSAEAREKLNEYQQLTAECQSPRFTREAARLRSLLQG